MSHETPYKAKPSAPLPKRERAWEVLREGLAENSAEKRAKAVSALGLLTRNTMAEEAGDEALKDEKHLVRVAAANALGTMRAVRSIPQLEAALDDQEPTVVLAAANSLMLLKDMRSAYDVYYNVLTGNMKTNRGLVREQVRTLRDPKKLAEMSFEEGIGFVPFGGYGYQVVKTIVKAENAVMPVRAAAAQKIAHDPSPEAADALVAATQDKSWSVRASALDAISQRGDASLTLRITPSLDDTKDEVRYMAAACIIHLSDLSSKRNKPVITAHSNLPQ